jgi:hypothetical protein
MVICCFSLQLLSAVLVQAEQGALTVEMTTMPAVETIRPDADLVRVTLTFLQHAQPLNQAHVQIDVTAPSHSRLLSTDFPIVEGTHLLSLASVITDGTLTFDYLFPIRGTYTFDVTVTPDPKNAAMPPTTVHKTLHLRENPAEVRHAWLLVAGLFVFGAISGIFMARSAAAKEQTATIIAFAILCAAALGAEAADAAATQTPQAPAGWSLEIQATPEQATVGEPVQLAIALKKDDKIFTAPMQVSLDIHHLEDDKAVFHTQTLAADGATSLRFQFFDGAPHTVTVTARPIEDMAFAQEAPPLRAVLGMEVMAIHPPLPVKLRTLALLIGVLVVGMLVGGFVLPVVKERGGA